MKGGTILSARRILLGGLVLAAGLLAVSTAPARDQSSEEVDRICTLIAREAEARDLPDAFLARFLFIQSGFDPDYTSPTGARGMAKIIPAIAAMQGFPDAREPETAILAAAKRLSELKARFGNLGLAAAAYHAGETTVRRWLDGDGYLPVSTAVFVTKVTGENPDTFRNPEATLAVKALESRFSFVDACKRLPLIARGEASTDAPSDMPWAVVVGAGVDLASAMDHWSETRERTGFHIEGGKVYVTHVDGGTARRNRYSVRIGAKSRGSAQAICSALRGKGGACLVTKARQ